MANENPNTCEQCGKPVPDFEYTYHPDGRTAVPCVCSKECLEVFMNCESVPKVSWKLPETLEGLELPTYILKPLLKAGISTPKDLLTWTRAEIKSLRGLGIRAVLHIVSALENFNCSLAD